MGADTPYLQYQERWATGEIPVVRPGDIVPVPVERPVVRSVVRVAADKEKNQTPGLSPHEPYSILRSAKGMRPLGNPLRGFEKRATREVPV